MKARWLPTWLATYDRGKAAQDLVAGIVVTILLVPQSLAYAMLAGLPPHVGMYASILPLVAYAVLGSSMTLSVGPVAVASLMTASAVAPLAAAGSAEYVLLAMLLALMGGVVLLLLGLLRMGFVANLLSHPVISGFVTGSAVLIALGQLKPLLGIPAKGETALELAVSLFSRAGNLHVPKAVLGLSSVLALWASRRFLAGGLRRAGMGNKSAEIVAKLAPMVVVLLAIAAVVGLGLDTDAGVGVVGSIPAGLPSLAFTLPTMGQLQALAVPAVMIALIGFVESVSVAQSLAIKRGERINPDAELRGLGAANLASAISGGFPVTGGFARSVVNFAAGARTPLAGVIAAVFMGVVLLGLTGLFERLPLAVLAATIMVAVVELVDLATVRHAWHYDRADAVAWLVTAVGVLALGVEAGVGLGVAMSIGTFLWRASRPHIAVVGRVGDSEHFRNERRFAVRTYPGLLLMRIDESLFFANMPAVLGRIEEEIERHVMARMEDGSATMFLTDMDRPGIRLERNMEAMDRCFTGGHGVLVFENLRVAAEDVLGEVGQGLRYAQVRLAPARLTHCMRWLGQARRAHEIAVDYARQRCAFGKPLAEHEGVGFMLADNDIDLQTARLHIWHTAWLLDRGEKGNFESSRAKVACSEAEWRVVDRCVQILGGQGVTAETAVMRIFMDMRAFRIYDGPSEVHRWSMARKIVHQANQGAAR